MRRIVGVPVDAAGGPSPRNPEGRPILAPDSLPSGRLEAGPVGRAPLAMRRIATQLAPSP
jgi:hypothetical protein